MQLHPCDTPLIADLRCIRSDQARQLILADDLRKWSKNHPHPPRTKEQPAERNRSDRQLKQKSQAVEPPPFYEAATSKQFRSQFLNRSASIWQIFSTCTSALGTRAS